MNKKRLLTALTVVLMLALLLVSGAYAAEDDGDPVKLQMELSANEFSEPKTITVSITVTNTSDAELPGPVTLYYPDGKQIEEFGEPVLAPGASKPVTVTWKVTQAQLEAGKLPFKIKYSYNNNEGKLVNKSKAFSRKLTYSGAQIKLDINRTVTPTLAQQGQEVTVVYELTNSGNTEITSVTIKENSSVSSTSAKIEKIAAGEKASKKFTVKMGTKDLTSAGTITYKANGKTYTDKLEPQTVKYGKVDLSATLKADRKGGAPGDTVNLTVTLKNSGAKDMTNVTITSDVLGTILENGVVTAGESMTYEKAMTVTETQDVRVNVTAVDGDGAPVETASGTVTVIATDPTKQIGLTVNAQPDTDVVYMVPGIVKFTVTVTNDSAVEATNVLVKAVNRELFTFDSIPAGESRSFSRETMVSMAGTFQFTASCKDELGQTITFPSNMVLIQHVPPTPVPTEAPIVTPPRPVMATPPVPQSDPMMDQIQDISKKIRLPLAGVSGGLILLLVIGLIRRIAKKVHSNKAQDHMDRGTTCRSYTDKVDRKHRSEIYDALDTQEPAETEATDGNGTFDREDNVQDSDLMAETLKRLYADPPKTPETVIPVDEPHEMAENDVAQTEPENREVRVEDARAFARRRRQ